MVKGAKRGYVTSQVMAEPDLKSCFCCHTTGLCVANKFFERYECFLGQPLLYKKQEEWTSQSVYTTDVKCREC